MKQNHQNFKSAEADSVMKTRVLLLIVIFTAFFYGLQVAVQKRTGLQDRMTMMAEPHQNDVALYQQNNNMGEDLTGHHTVGMEYILKTLLIETIILTSRLRQVSNTVFAGKFSHQIQHNVELLDSRTPPPETHGDEEMGTYHKNSLGPLEAAAKSQFYIKQYISEYCTSSTAHFKKMPALSDLQDMMLTATRQSDLGQHSMTRYFETLAMKILESQKSSLEILCSRLRQESNTDLADEFSHHIQLITEVVAGNANEAAETMVQSARYINQYIKEYPSGCTKPNRGGTGS